MRFNYREKYLNDENFKTFEHSVPGVLILVDYDNLVAMTFIGKRSKPEWRYKFTSLEKMLKHIDNTISTQYNSNKTKEEQKAKDKILAKENRSKVQVGDIYCLTSSYENTYVDFYQITAKVSPSKVKAKRIGSTSRENGYASAYKKPIKNDFISEEETYTVSKYGNLRMGYYSAHKTDENSEHYTSWGY